MTEQKQKQAELAKSVAAYATSDIRVSMLQILNTFIPFFLLCFLAYQSLSVSIWLSLALSVIASGFVVRIFIIFHDCTHMSFFKKTKWNRFLGILTGIITHFPFEKWRHDHIVHHATSGNLDKRGVGDIWLMTVAEYKEASFWQKLAYRAYRNPIVMFGLGPLYLLLINNRMNRKGASRKERWNTYVTNLVLVACYALLIGVVGWKAVLLVQVPMMYIAGALGIWLFYVQHQFEESYFEHDEAWNYVNAAVEGSTYYKLPKVLQWMTGNIGFHHVHHLSPKVPNYLLEKAHNEIPPLQKAATITLRTSLEAVKFRLFDEQTRMFITFKDYKKMQMQTKRPTNASGKIVKSSPSSF